MNREHDRAIEEVKREVASRQNVIDNFEKQTEGLRTQAKENAERANAAQLRFDWFSVFFRFFLFPFFFHLSIFLFFPQFPNQNKTKQNKTKDSTTI